MTKVYAYLKPIEDPFMAFKRMAGTKPDKWAVMIPQSAPYEDDPFGFYQTKAEAIVDAAKYDLTLTNR